MSNEQQYDEPHDLELLFNEAQKLTKQQIIMNYLKIICGKEKRRANKNNATPRDNRMDSLTRRR